MEEDELLNRLKANDVEAQKKWLHQYKQKIAQFAFIYGLTTRDAEEVAVRTFRKLFAQLPTIESERDLQKVMYQTAIQFIEKYELSTINEFLFPEDHDLHSEMTRLSHLEKLILIFTTFTTLVNEEIALILNLTVDEVATKQSVAKSHLSGPQIEKRLQLLGKSYQRLNFHVNEEEIFQVEEIEFEAPPFKSSKRNIYLLITGMLMLMGLVFYSIWHSESFQQARFEKSIEKKRETYSEKRQEVFAELGVSEKEVEEIGMYTMFNQQYLSNEESQNFERFMTRIERDIEREKPIDQQEIEEEYTIFIESLRTPRELVEDLFKKPLTDDFEASEKFLEEFLLKYYAANALYSEMIREHQEVLEAQIKPDGSYGNLGEVILQMDQLPEKVEQTIDNMAKQNMYFIGYSAKSDEERAAFLENLRGALHPDVGGYLTMLKMVDSGDLFWSMLDVLANPDEIKEMEATLLKSKMAYESKQLLEYRYIVSILVLLGQQSVEIYDDHGFIQQEYRDKWRELTKEDGVAQSIFKKVIGEFEENDWRMSKTQIYLSENKIWELLNSATSGNLEAFDWGDIQKVDFQSVTFPNPGYVYLLDEVYPKIKQDSAILAEHHPIITISAYMRALEQADLKLLTILSTEQVQQPELETQIQQWQDKKLSEAKIEYVYFDRLTGQSNFTLNDHYGSLKLVERDGRWRVVSYKLDEEEDMW